MNFRRHLRGAEVPWSQITPLLTVVFVLFCLFVGNLVLAPVARNEMRIHLPVSTSGQSIEHGADELIVELASNHVMTVNGQALSRDELRARLLQ